MNKSSQLTKKQLINKLSLVLFLCFLIRGNAYHLFADPYKKTLDVDLELFNNSYRLLTDKKFHKDIDQIFANEPFYTNVNFSITYVPRSIITKMFNDLEYTAENGKKYGNSPYVVIQQDDFYKVRVRDYSTAEIYLPYVNNRINRYIYYIEGAIDTFVTLEGKMVVDIEFRQVNRNVFFSFKAFLILTNPIYWNLFKRVKNSKEFGKRVDRLISNNINYIIKLGRVTAKGIYRDSRNKFKF